MSNKPIESRASAPTPLDTEQRLEAISEGTRLLSGMVGIIHDDINAALPATDKTTKRKSAHFEVPFAKLNRSDAPKIFIDFTSKHKDSSLVDVLEVDIASMEDRKGIYGATRRDFSIRIVGRIEKKPVWYLDIEIPSREGGWKNGPQISALYSPPKENRVIQSARRIINKLNSPWNTPIPVREERLQLAHDIITTVVDPACVIAMHESRSSPVPAEKA